MKNRTLTLANKITIARIMLIPVFMVFLLSRHVLSFVHISLTWGVVIAGGIFIIAAVSDTIDGYVARVRGEITTVGQILDPLADKLLVSAALISLVDLGRLSAWIAMVIIGREFAVMGLRMTAAVKHVVIPASKLGKAKTIFQILAIVVVMIRLPIPFWWTAIEWTMLAAAVVLTLLSGFDYFRRAWTYLLTEEAADEV